jgi:hypothetical protein
MSTLLRLRKGVAANPTTVDQGWGDNRKCLRTSMRHRCKDRSCVETIPLSGPHPVRTAPPGGEECDPAFGGFDEAGIIDFLICCVYVLPGQAQSGPA